MKRKIYSVILFCSLFVGQMFAANEIYLPTVAYRSDGQEKTVYEYNEAGYMTSGKLYVKFGGSDEYYLQNSVTYDYHCLSNGEYVQTKMETGEYRSSSAYDANDMLLWKQTETFTGNQWVLQSRTEAVLDANGIRTGIREYSIANGWQTWQGYTFDNQGRQIRYEGYSGSTPVVYTATWGSGRLYTGYMRTVGDVSMVYQNIVPVLNEQYFNPYDLFGAISDESSMAGVPPVLLEPSYVDYEMHHPFYSGEVVYMGNTYAQTIVQDNANSEISEIIKLGNTEIQKTVYKTLTNGGWSRTFYESGEITEQSGKEYDSHGFLKKESSGYGNEITYAIEYDTQGRPTKATKTSVYNGNSYVEEETYTAWTVLGTTGISLITTDDPIISTQYYDLTGRVVQQLQPYKIYIAKDLHRSGKASARKLIEK
ncbi:MAG: hypothetical protein LBR66_00685 [Candidatus Symbiothrix sp.]|jgi:hypothetical protein|nr:hypothetical protein [Candidatus Symbiothrix sp.]